MRQPVVELQDVWKIYRLGDVNVPALRGLSFKIYAGDCVSIMGPSGSGKSTCMHMIGCLDRPTRGRVLLGGQDISKIGESDLATIRGKKIGFVFQQFNLINTLTAFENVMLPMLFQKDSKALREKRAAQLLEEVGLKGRMRHRPRQLSGGEQQRVAIARALANDPEIILADEPTGNLDSSSGKMVMDMLIRLHEEHKKTLVVVTHDPYIAKHTHRVLFLKDGQLAKDHRIEKRVLWASDKAANKFERRRQDCYREA
ncbi:MAG: ABC transporter ATP-binding protein [Candidatus Aenigmatarchaeota archaeon]